MASLGKLLPERIMGMILLNFIWLRGGDKAKLNIAEDWPTWDGSQILLGKCFPNTHPHALLWPLQRSQRHAPYSASFTHTHTHTHTPYSERHTHPTLPPHTTHTHTSHRHTHTTLPPSHTHTHPPYSASFTHTHTCSYFTSFKDHRVPGLPWWSSTWHRRGHELNLWSGKISTCFGATKRMCQQLMSHRD